MLPQSTPTLLRRNDASPPTGTAALTDLTRALVKPTVRIGAISSAPAASSAFASVSSNDANSGWPSYDSDSSFQSSWVAWLAIIIVVGVLFALFASRFFYIRKVYQTPSFRAFFVPQKGIHVKFLRIHIDGPPGRSPSFSNSAPYSISGAPAARRRRRRRHRQTVGETLGAGGTRLGSRDEDDGWDDDGANGDGDEEEQVGMTEARRRTRADEALPQYFADSGLPAYASSPPAITAPSPPSPSAAPNARLALAHAAAAAPAGNEVDVLPSAAEYEAFSRGGRDGDAAPSSFLPLTALAPTYPPPAHLHGSIPSDPPPSFSRSASMVRSSSEFEEDDDGGRPSMRTASSSATKLDGKEKEAEATKMGVASASAASTTGSGAGEKNVEEKGDKEGP